MTTSTSFPAQVTVLADAVRLSDLGQREGEDPQNHSHLPASPGTVSSVFPPLGAQELRARPPRGFPTLRVGFVNGMSYQ
jgi:hypothetical protein